MSLPLSIGGQDLCLEASPEILESVRLRFGRFEGSTSGDGPRQDPIKLEVHARPGGFLPICDRPAAVSVRAVGSQEVVIEGAVRGRYLVEARRGYIEDAPGPSAVDALIRVALSISTPLDGALLMHAAAIPTPSGHGIVLCGESGTGKSTAATAFGGACDELVVLRPAVDRVYLYSTPYWRGFPFRGRCTSVICLERGRASDFALHRGSTAALCLARHVVRYVAIEPISRAILRVIGRICEAARVATAACPEGEAFVPFLRDAIKFDQVSANASGPS